METAVLAEIIVEDYHRLTMKFVREIMDKTLDDGIGDYSARVQIALIRRWVEYTKLN